MSTTPRVIALLEELVDDAVLGKTVPEVALRLITDTLHRMRLDGTRAKILAMRRRR